MCSRCIVSAIKHTVATYPVCPVYGCDGVFNRQSLDLVTRHNADLSRKLADVTLMEELAACDVELSHQHCPFCKMPVRPHSFVQDFKITVCVHCDRCWCDICRGFAFGSEYFIKSLTVFYVSMSLRFFCL